MTSRELAEHMWDRAHYWADYANSTWCDRRITYAVSLQERYFRAYHYLMGRVTPCHPDDMCDCCW